jgi:hypothetical protein
LGYQAERGHFGVRRFIAAFRAQRHGMAALAPVKKSGDESPHSKRERLARWAENMFDRYSFPQGVALGWTNRRASGPDRHPTKTTKNEA